MQHGFTDSSVVRSSELKLFLEVLVPFESCYYHLRQGKSLEAMEDRGMVQALLTESTASVRSKIEQLFVPLLAEAVQAKPAPGTSECDRLYVLVPTIRNYLALSCYFLSSSMEYLCSTEGVEMRSQLQALLGRATEIMEYHASHTLEKLLSQVSESSARALFNAFTHPDFSFPDPVLDFERIPAAHAELVHCNFTPQDHVLFVGCGSLSISGLAYANAGATVTLVDIDPHALESFSRIYAVLPEYMQRRINRRIVPMDDYCYMSEGSYTHIGLAGLVGGKDQILRSVQQCLHCKQQSPTLLVRAPKPNLLRLFYYDANVKAVAEQRYVVSDPGIEAPLVTHVVQLKSIRSGDVPSNHNCPVLSRVFLKNEDGVEYPVLLS